MNDPSDRDAYWFPAKPSGLGWGLPTCWQGWTVYAIFAAGFLVGVLGILPVFDAGVTVLWFLLLSFALVFVLKSKGEPLPPIDWL